MLCQLLSREISLALHTNHCVCSTLLEMGQKLPRLSVPSTARGAVGAQRALTHAGVQRVEVLVELRDWYENKATLIGAANIAVGAEETATLEMLLELGGGNPLVTAPASIEARHEHIKLCVNPMTARRMCVGCRGAYVALGEFCLPGNVLFLKDEPHLKDVFQLLQLWRDDHSY